MARHALISRLLRRRDQILFQLAVGISVSRQPQPLAGINNVESAECHAAPQLLAGLCKAERLAQRRQAVAKVGERLGGKVVAQVRRQQAAVNASQLQIVKDRNRLPSQPALRTRCRLCRRSQPRHNRRSRAHRI